MTVLPPKPDIFQLPNCRLEVDYGYIDSDGEFCVDPTDSSHRSLRLYDNEGNLVWSNVEENPGYTGPPPLGIEF